FTILTKQASPLFAEIHNKRKRQPILLSKDIESDWLSDNLSEDDIKELINTPYNESDLDTYTVSKDLFKAREYTNVETITRKVDYPELNTLF
ncbi:MAG: SOS response-associated peptidase family protein, partial [Algibacter sp.]|uniref:SOS response-associated peptidase family protein n=1 Tax=Algibacter sp. TaxID=1872428 RepID=UPI00262199FB